MPGETQGKTWKFARPFHGPFKQLRMFGLVDEPQSKSLFVSLNRVRTYVKDHLLVNTPLLR